jgi:hypothetical protein
MRIILAVTLAIAAVTGGWAQTSQFDDMLAEHLEGEIQRRDEQRKAVLRAESEKTRQEGTAGKKVPERPPEFLSPKRSSCTFGWDGDKHAALASPGEFLIRDDGNKKVTFGIFRGIKELDWYNHSGYLPCLVTAFERDGCSVKIMSFGDRVSIVGNDFVIAYSRVAITNHGATPVTLSPEVANMIALNNPGERVGPGQTVNHDFAAALDRFGDSYAFPSEDALKAAGGWESHFRHMEQYWNDKLACIAQVCTPDKNLNDAYRAGYCYTHIVKDGDRLHVGENGYDAPVAHDYLGILVTLLTIGHLDVEVKTLLENLPTKGYRDTKLKYAFPWALYLLKTGDSAFVRAHWDTIGSYAHEVVSARQGPGGLVGPANYDMGHGCWVASDWAALTGLAAYAYLCERLGEGDEKAWADREYGSLFAAAEATLISSMASLKIGYIPGNWHIPNTVTMTRRTKGKWDGAWAEMFLYGRWAWDGWLVGARQSGPMIDLLDATYEYNFKELEARGFPAHTAGGFDQFAVSSGYNVGFMTPALRGKKYRTEPILAYQYLIEHCQGGPYSWWESINWPSTTSGWRGSRAGGGGSCPHIWGQSFAIKGLVESLIAEFYDGRVLVGRGAPADWLREGFSVENYPIRGGKRMGVKVKAVAPRRITLEMSGDPPAAEIVFSLPVFIDNIAAATAGEIDAAEGTVTVQPTVRTVTVTARTDWCRNE